MRLAEHVGVGSEHVFEEPDVGRVLREREGCSGREAEIRHPPVPDLGRKGGQRQRWMALAMSWTILAMCT